MVHGEKTYTKNDNMRAPLMDDYLQWIYDAWKQFPDESILKSFKGCGLTNALDGSEDNEIHCFKSNGPIPTGREFLQQARTEAEMTELIQQLEVDEDGYDSNTSIDIMA
jgi:hypothetical protein